MRRTLALSGALALLCPFPALAALRGHLADATGAALPGVRVEATCDQVSENTLSSGDGSYALPRAAGTCDLRFGLPGFVSALRHGIATDRAEPLDVTLQLGLSTHVVVSGRSTFRDLSRLGSSADLLGVASAASTGVVAASQIQDRALSRPGDLLEHVPGVVISQHSGEGKANQYYVRGFNIDHGTDLAISVAGLPVNLPTHAHGQGYADVNFLIPEIVSGIQFRKGPYHAEEGDFSAAGAVHVEYASVLEAPLARLEVGDQGYRRGLVAAAPAVGRGHLLAAFEAVGNDGPWVRPDDLRKLNGVLRYSRGSAASGFALTALGYDAHWDSTDQVPDRAIASGQLDRYGSIDASDGGATHRYALLGEWQRTGGRSLSRVEGFAARYGLDLWSNFTYFLDDPEHGDQFQQSDRRWTYGLSGHHEHVGRLFGRPLDLSAGVQLRHDDIGQVGLFHTERRRWLSTVREDAVQQSSAGLYASATLQVAARARATLGLRGDLHRFDVEAGDPRNGGVREQARVSPKLALALGPWADTEVYASYGHGFHSNDARGATIRVDPASGEPAQTVDPLVRARGAELGVRTLAVPHVHSALSLWGLWIDSELLFVGDAGSTEASRPSRRWGVEWETSWSPRPWFSADASVALSRARFTDLDPAGPAIPGAVRTVAAAGLAVTPGRFSGSLRLRHFGPRPLLEDGSVESRAATTLNAEVGFRVAPRVRVLLEVLNVLDARVSDVDYFYASRLPGEDAQGIEDTHTHPLAPRSFRVGIASTF